MHVYFDNKRSMSRGHFKLIFQSFFSYTWTFGYPSKVSYGAQRFAAQKWFYHFGCLAGGFLELHVNVVINLMSLSSKINSCITAECQKVNV